MLRIEYGPTACVGLNLLLGGVEVVAGWALPLLFAKGLPACKGIDSRAVPAPICKIGPEARALLFLWAGRL